MLFGIYVCVDLYISYAKSLLPLHCSGIVLHILWSSNCQIREYVLDALQSLCMFYYEYEIIHKTVRSAIPWSIMRCICR